MKINTTYWVIILGLNFIPVIIIQKIIGFFWSSDSTNNTQLATLNLLLTIMIVPFVLIILNYGIAKKYSQKYFVINGFLISCSVLLCAHLGFINWADSVGSIDNADQETIGVVNFEKMAGIALTIAGTIIG